MTDQVMNTDTSAESSSGIGFLLALGAGIDSMNNKADELLAAMQKSGEYVFQQPLYGQVPLSAGAGTLDGGANASLTPPRGMIWSVRRLSATGFTAGSVTGYINQLEPVAPFPNPAVFTFGRGEVLLQPGDRLVFVATGITGAVNIFGVSDTFPYTYLTEYLN